jgi:NarL family two-component system response regulator LiaR
VDAALREQPDLALLDVNMPGSGLAAAWEITARLPATRVVMLTISRDDSHVFAALRAGAAGYLLKNVQPSELHRAILAAHAGEALLDPVVAARLLDAIARPAGAPAPGNLTPREREVLELLARGYANKRIARELGVAEKTVKTHVGHVLAKLGVTDRTQAALLAVREGLVGQRS